ncbi:MAG TPA: cytochrome c peroxidase, partial [Candidatus Angelobacter sp.]|nr:cytochrome c peroxidase [Candidatus Angelobacter sp.]
MKLSSGIRTTLRVFSAVLAIVAALGYFSHVRAQSGVGAIRVPLRPLAPLSTVPIPPVFGIEGIINDKTAAIQLGKALFWDMQAGSDDIQACASCHFNAGADSRATNDVNPDQPGGDNSFQLGVSFNGAAGPNYHYNPGTANAGFGGYHDGDFPFHKVSDVNNNTTEISDLNDVSGSQGVFSTNNAQVTVTGGQVDNSGSKSGAGAGANAPKCQHEINDIVGGDDEPVGELKSNVHGAGRIASPALDQSGSTGGTTCVAQPEPLQITSRTSVETDSSVPDPVFSYPDPDDASKRINTRRTTGR